MIHKIEKLNAIGKFRNYQATGQVNFHKLTLIYGDNGSGKTTLTSVFRSLANNNPEIIRNRVSTNSTIPQSGQIVESGTPHIYHTFGTQGWTVPWSDIEVFDIHFVNDNIYSGFDFNDEHKKHLHQFVIGAQGIALREQIQANKENKSTARRAISDIELQLIQGVGNNLTSDMINSFLSLSPDQADNINEHIQVAENALVAANSNLTIQSLRSPIRLPQIPIFIDFLALATDMEATMQAIQDETLQVIFEEHCSELSNNEVPAPERWLKEGFSYLLKKEPSFGSWVPGVLSCPMCKQGVDNSLDILKAYSLQFNQQFSELVERIQNYQSMIQNFNLEVIIQDIKTKNQGNIQITADWTTHLGEAVQVPEFDFNAYEENLRNYFNTFTELLQQKLQNPLNVVNLPTDLQSLIQTINTTINTQNQHIDIYNEEIVAFKSQVQSVADAQLQVDKLKRIKKRFEAPIIDFCDQLSLEKGTLRTLEQAYPSLIRQQQAEAMTFFTQYKTRMNYYLRDVFRTHFLMDDVTHVSPRGQSTESKIGYKLTFDGQEISFNPDDQLSAKDSLSEGDKTTLALSFFLSKLDIDPNKQDKILIFDDPLSSLDTNRRTYTVGIIKSLVDQMKQVVVLSHNEYFLHQIEDGFIAADKKTLRITEIFVDKASKIELCDLNDLVKNDYFKYLEALEDFRINPDHAKKDIVFGWLRNVLETHIRFKFYMSIRNMGGQATFGRLITYIDRQQVVFRDNTNRQRIVDKLNLINSVSWMPHHGIARPNFTTLGIDPHSITAAELDNLIQDTLDLIENKL